MALNFNVDPFFDDFDQNKNFNNSRYDKFESYFVQNLPPVAIVKNDSIKKLTKN